MLLPQHVADGECGIQPQRKSLEAVWQVQHFGHYSIKQTLSTKQTALGSPSCRFPTCPITETFSTPRPLLLRLAAQLNTHNDSLVATLLSTPLKRRLPISSAPRIGSQIQVLLAKLPRRQSKLEKTNSASLGAFLLIPATQFNTTYPMAAKSNIISGYHHVIMGFFLDT